MTVSVHTVARPDRDIARVVDAHRRLVVRVQGLSDDDMRRPSGLPDWTVAHVLTHLARNADSHARRTDAAVEGVVVDQYPGGVAGRQAEIESGAHRPAAAIIADVRESAGRVDELWQQVRGRERALRDLPARRWQEVEVHLVDLDLGVTHRDWSDDFVERWLPVLRQRMQAELGDAQALPTVEDARDELAWLYGRLKREDLPEPPPWG